MSSQTVALRAPDYIKIASRLIAAHGWCGSSADPIGADGSLGLNLTRAITWAVGGEGCAPRDLTDEQAEHVAEVIDHLEAPHGLGMEICAYERQFAGASAKNVAWEILIAAVRWETYLANTS